MTQTQPPPEPPGGQDDPPDVRLAVLATIRLLNDLGPVLADDPDRGDLVLRLIALRSALRRLARHIEDREG